MTLGTSLRKIFFIFFKIQDGRRGSKIFRRVILFSSHWKVGSSMNCFFTGGGGGGGGGGGRVLLPLSIFCNNLDPVHRIHTKFGMDILLDPRNKPAKEFFIFLKIQDGRRRSKRCDALYFFNVFAITSIRLIGSRQNLA